MLFTFCVDYAENWEKSDKWALLFRLYYAKICVRHTYASEMELPFTQIFTWNRLEVWEKNYGISTLCFLQNSKPLKLSKLADFEFLNPLKLFSRKFEWQKDFKISTLCKCVYLQIWYTYSVWHLVLQILLKRNLFSKGFT